MRQVVGFGDRSTGTGTFGANLERAIVTNGDFTAYVSDSAATRPSSQITLGRLVSVVKLPLLPRIDKFIAQKQVLQCSQVNSVN